MKKLAIIVAILICCGLYAMVKFSMSQGENANDQAGQVIEKSVDGVAKPNNSALLDSSDSKPKSSEVAFPKAEVNKQEQQRQMIDHFNKVKQEIFHGREFNDQSTPANIFLTFISALYHEDWVLFWQIYGVEKPVGPFDSETREHLLRLFKEKMTISLIPVVDKSPKESDLYAIYTGKWSDREIDQVWTFSYIEGAWRLLGSTSETTNWRTYAEQGEARRRNRIIGNRK